MQTSRLAPFQRLKVMARSPVFNCFTATMRNLGRALTTLSRRPNLLGQTLLFCFLTPIPFLSQESALQKHLRIAQAHFDQERFQEAIAELLKVIAIDPSIPGTYYQLGYSCWKLGNLTEAKSHFE